MNRFYVTLPSNSSSEYYPDNTVARYTTKLANKVELEGDWEVGLVEISFPSAVDNVVQDRCYYDIYFGDETMHRLLLPPSNYNCMETLVAALYQEQYNVEGIEQLVVTFAYESDDVSPHMGGKVSLHIADDVKVQFSGDLALMLGLDKDVKYSGDSERFSTSLNASSVHSVYVYCDVLEHVAVGDTRAPLLRIVDKPKNEQDVNVHKIMNPILYVPLQKKNFDTVEINMITDDGIPMPFRSGKSFVVLEFRRSLHAYFGL